MARFHLHLLLLQGWCLALLARGGPIHHSDHSASLNITLSADSSTKPTALLVKQLITTSFVETMPAFLATQSARLELVNGNPCYTVETLDHTEVGNLMARKTCWCMTVIEVPVTPSPMNKPPMAIATATATPVYTTTVTVFANSVIEAVFESMKGPHDKLTTSSRHRFKPKMKSSISWLGPSSSSPDNELGSSTWIPENIISPSWPTNTLVNDASIDPSQSLISGIDPSWNSSTLTIIEPTATLALSSLEPFTDVLASPSWKVANWDSSEIISSGGMQLSLPLEPSVGEESASYRWSELPTPVLGTIELTDESSIASTDGKNVLSTGTSVSIFGEVATPEMPVDNTTGTLTLDTEPSPSIAGASDLFSSRSGNIDSENLTAEPTSLTTLSTINLINTWDVVATSQLSYRSVGDVTEWSQEGTPILSTVTEWYQEGSPILSTATYASSADWETDESRVPPLWSSKGDSSDLRFFATPPWAHNSSLVTESDSESTWKIETPTLALDIMSSTGGEPPGSETIPCSPLGSEAFRPLLASQNTSNQSSIYGDEITTDSIIKTPLPILSTTDEFKILPSLTANPTYVSAILLPISPSIIGTALATMDTSSAHDVETWVTSSGISLEASSSGFPTSRLSATSSVNEARLTGSPAAGFSITPSSNLLPSISTNVPVEGSYINVSWYTTILSSEKSSTSVSTWTHTIQATFVPTPTNKPPISSFAPDFSNTTKPPPREQDPHYWIQTELRIPVGVNSTDTPALVKNLAFLYERAYAYQYRRQRRFARPTSIKLIHVIIDYKDRNITLVYVLYHRGRLVPAIEAVETIRVVRKADMEKTLKHGVIVKAKPYDPWTSSAFLKGRQEPWYRTKLAWILVLVLLLLLLLLVLLLCCLCVRTRKRQKAEVKDAEVSSSFSQGEGRFSTTSEATMPGESIRSYRDAVTSPVHFGETGTYRRSESPRFYENQAFEGSLEESRARCRPVLTQHTFEATFEGHCGQARAELTPPEVKPRRRLKHHSEQQNSPSNELSAYQDVRIPASKIQIRPVVREFPSEDEDASEKKIAEARRQLESMTERLNALVDNSLTVEETRGKLYGSACQRLLVARKDYKHRSRSADAIDSYLGVSSVPSVSNPVYRDQPTQTSDTAQRKRSTPPHFLVTIHKEVARTEQRIRHRHHQRTVEEWSSANRRTQYCEPTAQVIQAIRQELDRAQESNRESFA